MYTNIVFDDRLVYQGVPISGCPVKTGCTVCTGLLCLIVHV